MSINPTLAGKRILLVDDDEDRRVLLTQFFKIFQTDLITAASGKEGLGLLGTQGQSFDLIILDVMMGDMLGWDVFKQTKLADENFDTPVLFLTSLGEEARGAFEALDAGPNCRLESKGISTNELMKVAETMIAGA
jgi:DNA-binding response OmpR family regulator